MTSTWAGEERYTFGRGPPAVPLDLGLDWGPITRAGVVVEVLLEEPFVIVVQADHPLARKRVVSREAFASIPFLGLQFGVRTPGFAEAAMNEAGLRPNIVMRFPSTDAVKRLAEVGLGIGCMGRIAAERELAMGTLTTLNVEDFSLRQPLLVFRPESRLRSPAVAHFYQFLFQHPRVRTSQRLRGVRARRIANSASAG